MAVADAPRRINTMVKPATKARELIMTLNLTLLIFSEFESSCIDSPEINDIYPGISGSTHGERKESRPAIKAPIKVISEPKALCKRSSPVSLLYFHIV
jgi:hypothetical protein